jgi:hypothetical protein
MSKSNVEFKCCGQPFYSKYNLDRHKKSKRCKKNKNKNKKTIPCEYCNKLFSRKDTLKDHLDKDRCKGKKNNINNEVNGNDNELNYNNVVDSPNTNFTINKYGDNNHNNINIFLLNYPPNFLFIYENIKEILSSDEDLNLAIIKCTNINKNKPEHHNIFYQDKKSASGEIYKNNIWNTENINEITNLVLEANHIFLITIYNNIGPFLIKETNEKLLNAIKGYTDPKYRKYTKNKIKYLLYDNRNLIAATKNLIDESQKFKNYNFNGFDTNIKNLIPNNNNNNLSLDKNCHDQIIKNKQKNMPQNNQKSKNIPPRKKIIEDSNESSLDENCHDQTIKNEQKSKKNIKPRKKIVDIADDDTDIDDAEIDDADIDDDIE